MTNVTREVRFLIVKRRARALRAVKKMRADAKARGLDRLSFKQIDAIIGKTRKARRRRA